MRAAIFRRMPIVLVLLGLFIGAPALALSLAPAQPLCGAMDVVAMDHHDTRGGPSNPVAPEPGFPACQASAIGCSAVGLPSVGLPVPFVPLGRSWVAGPLGVGPGQIVEPDLSPPILSA